jgi:sterol 3beta-glucosyltransferase
MIARSGAGLCIPNQQLNEDNLCTAILQLLSREMQTAAQILGAQLRNEDGVTDATRSLFRHLPLLNMRQVMQETNWHFANIR